MKKLISLLLAVVLCLTFAGTISFADIDLSQYSDDELIELETAIQAEKISRGMAQEATVPKGTYTIGTDIPAGDYSVTGLGTSANFQVYSKTGLIEVNSVIWPNDGENAIGKVTLQDGQRLELTGTVKLVVYTGGITFTSGDSGSNSQTGSTITFSAPATTETAAAPAATKGEENALGSAKNYLSFMSFSYDGLREQLAFEGYSDSETKYAADNCGADWNEQAALSAKNYLSFMSFSKSSLIEQLQYEGFTYEQAVYGAEANGY